MITQTRLKELLHYCPDTGDFTWIKRTSNRIKVGSIVRSVGNHGYYRMGIDKNDYLVHRMAYLYMTGDMPDKEVDHINHNRLDNSWSNLRKATRQENARNCSLSKANTSGHTGVEWWKRDSNWRATIMIEGKLRHIGYYAEKSDAIAARRAADVENGFHNNHGDKAA